MPESRDHEPEEIFHALRDRATPELDEKALWRQLQSRLEPRRPARWVRWRPWDTVVVLPTPTWRMAGAAVAVAVVAVVLWQTPGRVPVSEQLTVGDPDSGAAAPADATLSPRFPIAERELVLLEGPDERTQPPAQARTWRLEVRLVRGFNGQPPTEAMGQGFNGAGGANALADLRATLSATFPYTNYVLIGAWSGEPERGAGTIELSPGHRLAFIAERTDADGTLTLRAVRLEGESEPLVADELILAPGGPYLFGVRPGSESGTDGSLVLAIVVRADPDPVPPTKPPVQR